MRGVWATASGERAGKVSFTPAHSGTWHGEFVSADQVNVEVGIGGAFTVDLVPSEAVGPYTVRAGDLVGSITVPTLSTANLADLWAAAGG